MLKFENKVLRAKVIADYLRRTARFDAGVVCFTCGNASRALEAEGLFVVEVGPRGGIVPSRWWSPAEIARAFPGLFDATSGHLPVPLMRDIGALYRLTLGDLPPVVRVPSGSGETVCCLALAYPETRFVAVYDDSNPATCFSELSPLNALVERLCSVERH